MAYCSECGSEVAEIDVFCPYCGIALQLVKPANKADSLSSAIIVRQPKVETPDAESQITNSSNDEEIKTVEENAPKVDEVDKPFENIDNLGEEFSNQDTAENWILKIKSGLLCGSAPVSR
jgi:uncharacterized Zn finger protein (UPF0148 family)